MIRDIRKIYNKYKLYDYIAPDFSNYHIKSLEEFDVLYGGICWDFVVAIAYELDRFNIPYKCYFSEIQKGNKTLATHTYVIIYDTYWVECSWQKYKGIYVVDSFTDIEDLLLEFYNCDEIHTVMYSPLDTVGKTDKEFFYYLNQYGIEVS